MRFGFPGNCVEFHPYARTLARLHMSMIKPLPCFFQSLHRLSCVGKWSKSSKSNMSSPVWMGVRWVILLFDGGIHGQENGKDPVTGETLTLEDLLVVKSNKVLLPTCSASTGKHSPFLLHLFDLA